MSRTPHLMTIGEFSERTRLSPKALRLYDQLALVRPARVDAGSGYRWYGPDQVESARLVGILRRLDMPLAGIASVLEMEPKDAADAISRYWAQVEAGMADQRELVCYLRARLTGDDPIMYDIAVRRIAERRILAISRHVTLGGVDAFFHDSFARLRAAAPGIDGIDGRPFLVFYGEVSDDSDGPIELCRPVASDPRDAGGGPSDIQHRIEGAHDEVSTRLTLEDTNWPAMLPACDALGRWVTENRRQPAGPLRQVFIADGRTATPDTPFCDLTIPLRPDE